MLNAFNNLLYNNNNRYISLLYKINFIYINININTNTNINFNKLMICKNNYYYFDNKPKINLKNLF